LVMLWRTESKPGKDARSPHARRMGATEDAAWRRLSVRQSAADGGG
jgi:hypothetical protein